MSQLAQGHYFPLIFGRTFSGTGELHLPERRSGAGLTNKKIALNR
ncbi:hypothetical protein SAMN03080602_00248 [Arenibacter troitsensis]|uniref:Uncharacterized protein n=1 Tax=Arenibacter troitsensis TaxID=188872 RepID=A0A1X7HZY6_9FLAO|nr:hypothetical protein SAMN03080602_00248 [Arenibacter troitsensis]